MLTGPHQQSQSLERRVRPGCRRAESAQTQCVHGEQRRIPRIKMQNSVGRIVNDFAKLAKEGSSAALVYVPGCIQIVSGSAATEAACKVE